MLGWKVGILLITMHIVGSVVLNRRLVMNKIDMFKPFSGSIDDLLKHVDKFNPDDVEKILIDKTDDVLLDDATAIEMIMSDANMDRETAMAILSDIKLEEVNRVIGSLIQDGLVEVFDYDTNGDPLYTLTSTGKVMAKKLKN